MILQKRGIFNDIQKLAEILLPIKDAILSLEKNSANLADCYINLLWVAASIKKMDQDDYKDFHTYMVQIFNKRYVIILSVTGNVTKKEAKFFSPRLTKNFLWYDIFFNYIIYIYNWSWSKLIKSG
jgi:hypothetical protein